MARHNNNSGTRFPVTIQVAQSYARLLQIIGLAAVYFIAGKLSYFLAISPEYASVIWPPSGIALAGVLIYGYRVWPGILLGVLLINGLVPEETRSISDNLVSVGITLVIGIGASLQAMLGTYLVRRYAGFPNGLTREKDILWFLFYGGLLSALVNSTLSVATFVATGRTSAESFLSNWGTWWLGDVLGIVIFTPLALVWMLQANPVWYNRRMAMTLPVFVLLALTATAVFFTRHDLTITWLIFLVGLVLTCLVGIFSLAGSGRECLLQLMVEERTATLEKLKRRFCSTFESAPIGIVNMSPEGLFLEVNQGFCDFIGISHQELLTLSFGQITHPDYHLADVEKIGRCLAGEISGFTVENKYLHRKGHLIWGHLTVKLIRHADGSPDYFIEIIEDITRRKEAEDSLRKLSMALEQSQSSVIITDLDATIEYVNEAFVKITGYSREEIIGQKPSLFKSVHTPKETYQSMWSALIAGKAWQGEVINKNKHGDEFIELTWISPIRQPNGEITHYLGVKEDITDRKHNENQLIIAKDRAELLAKTKAQFLANMSHEIRTPMNAILGFSELALNKNFPPEAVDYLQKINTASTSLLDILNDILDLSKLEAGRISIIPAPFHLDDLRGTLYSLFISVAQQQGLKFTLEVAPDVPLNVIGDALRLRQVLINLLGNAFKFTSSGSVSLCITLQQLDESEVRLLFCVKDTGVGIAVEDQHKLFQPFSQVDGSASRNVTGTGLGLAISRDLLKLMGSDFVLKSSAELGSSFSFELILGLSFLSEQDKVTPLESVRNFCPLLRGTKVLVAEDNFFNQQIVKELLSLSGIRVELASNGQEALIMLEQGDFDAVLMDLHMPVMDGFEATRQIRGLAQFATLPVIALTACVTQEDREECLAAGMNDFIGKPINTIQLLSTLAEWLNPDHEVMSEW
jgi:PAS domain S-box-containing protein